MLVDDKLQALENFLDSLQKLRLVGVAALHTRINALKVLIVDHCCSLLIFVY